MPDLLAQLLAFDGLGWLMGTVFIAGAVRGFTGFGAALVYMPVAGQLMPPIWALITLILMEVIGPLPNIPAALRVANRRDVGWLFTGAAFALPLGLAVLYRIDPDLFRYGVCLFALTVPFVLASGVRFQSSGRKPILIGTGAVSGFAGGVTGVPGPPVILMLMASSAPAQVIRANVMVYLLLFDVSTIVLLGAQGVMSAMPVMLGLALIVPNLLGNLVGAAMFQPQYQSLYRGVGYGVTLLSGVAGLPLWD
ncbi:MAG: sulfite exporter TauE/SafE family protein [Thalassovita sp.]